MSPSAYPDPEDRPEDIVAEEALARQMHRRSGVFKRQNSAPNIFSQAARTPGEVAKTILTIACYLGLMFLIVAFGGQRVRAVPGIFQVVGLGLLIIPAMSLSSLIWEAIGETARDGVRLLVRFWPLTLVLLVFALGGLRLLLE